jgi:hypothetical protein
MPANNVTVTANWSEDDSNTHTVTFVDWDGREITKVPVKHGESVTPPTVRPQRADHVFDGWDTPLDNITSDITVRATYVQEAVGSWAIMNLILWVIGVLLVLFALVRAFTKRTGWLWLGLSAVATIVSIVVFFVVQDMSKSVAFADWWTLLHIVLAAIGIVTIVLIQKSNEERNTREQGR